jgi:hypothetical protein
LSGPASALSSIKDSVSGLFSGFTNNFVKTGAKLPLPNPLFKYASYTYTLGLGCLSADQLNNPDTTYRAGKRVKLICKSASVDPNNRVKTPYGKFEFYLDDIEIKSLIGFEEGNNTNALKLKFKVTEPYSMGLFMIACQQAAQELKHPNYFEAPYILTIDFKGITETGKMETIPGTSRQIPFNFTIISMNASESGVYIHVKVYQLINKHYLMSTINLKVMLVQKVQQYKKFCKLVKKVFKQPPINFIKIKKRKKQFLPQTKY